MLYESRFTSISSINNLTIAYKLKHLSSRIYETLDIEFRLYQSVFFSFGILGRCLPSKNQKEDFSDTIYLSRNGGASAREEIRGG
ncbi:hypothetical protein GCM10007932_15150 [Vibrio penaeicida]|uniref:Uncharacterized protein n=1 Tax=Vibrio penaeicida TaxID=104609 RepID=A0AAV5NNZ6_9VIBR|nr:hypothetical protein GCM10007932_15150 [Vibrio penaeicida]